MPQVITNDQGEEVEVYTSEELQEQREAALEEFKKENASVSEEKEKELELAQEQLREANEKLSKFEGKELNFSKLREQKKDAEESVKKIQSEMEERLGAMKREILESTMKDHYNDVLSGLAGDDDDLRKKVEFEYNRLSDAAGTKEEIGKKLRDAYTLATRTDDAGVLTGSAVSSSGASVPSYKNKGSFTDEEKAFAKKLGLTDKDLQ